MKTVIFWLCISAVIGAAAWTAVVLFNAGGDGARKTAERVLRDRAMTKVQIDGSVGRADIWCPQGTGAVLFSGVDRSGKAMKGVVCTSRGLGIVQTIE